MPPFVLTMRTNLNHQSCPHAHMPTCPHAHMPTYTCFHTSIASSLICFMSSLDVIILPYLFRPGLPAVCTLCVHVYSVCTCVLCVLCVYMCTMCVHDLLCVLCVYMCMYVQGLPAVCTLCVHVYVGSWSPRSVHVYVCT